MTAAGLHAYRARVRWLALLLPLACAALAAAAGPRVSPEEAASHRSELVTLVGPVTEVQRRDDGMLLMVGTGNRVAVLVPRSALGRFPRDLTGLHEQTVEVTGFLTSREQPLALVLDQPDNLAVASLQVGEVQTLQDRVRDLEAEVARLRARTVAPPLQLITYGPGRQPQAVSPYAMETTVLADRGIPDRVEWGSRGRILYYGNTRYVFDAHGQLIEKR